MRTALILAAFLATSRASAQSPARRYATALVEEMETFEKTSEVTVRLDSDHGNEFFCHESQSDTLRVDNSGMWRACLAKLVRSTPGVRVADFPREIVYYEPVFLSLFARSGWEIYHVEQDNGDGKLEAGNGHRYFLRK